MSGRIIKNGRVQVVGAAGHPGPDAPRAEGAARCEDVAPKLTLHREGDLVEAIELTCSCGRTTIIECRYEEEERS